VEQRHGRKTWFGYRWRMREGKAVRKRGTSPRAVPIGMDPFSTTRSRLYQGTRNIRRQWRVGAGKKSAGGGDRGGLKEKKMG